MYEFDAQENAWGRREQARDKRESILEYAQINMAKDIPYDINCFTYGTKVNYILAYLWI